MDFEEEMVQKVWELAHEVEGVNPDQVRQDQCGAWLKRKHYQERRSPYGWDIDWIHAKEDGGGPFLDNLRPLHWKNMATKEDGFLTCPIRAKGTKNAVVKPRSKRSGRHQIAQYASSDT